MKNQWKRLVKSRIKMSAEIELKEQIKTYKKLENIDVENEAFEPKAYLTELNLSQARIKFKLRNRMLEIKNNFKGEHIKTNLLCLACQTSLETQDHILFCPSYSDLRQDMDIHCDKNLVDYIREVMKLRDKIKKK